MGGSFFSMFKCPPDRWGRNVDAGATANARVTDSSSRFRLLEHDLLELGWICTQLLLAGWVTVHLQHVRHDGRVFAVTQARRLVRGHGRLDDGEEVAQDALLPPPAEGVLDERGRETFAAQVSAMTERTVFLIAGLTARRLLSGVDAIPDRWDSWLGHLACGHHGVPRLVHRLLRQAQSHEFGVLAGA